jgi:hypothetical protein
VGKTSEAPRRVGWLAWTTFMANLKPEMPLSLHKSRLI